MLIYFIITILLRNMSIVNTTNQKNVENSLTKSEMLSKIKWKDINW